MSKSSMPVAPSFGFYVDWPEHRRFVYQTFHSPEAAKHFLDLIIAGDETHWDVFRTHKQDTGVPLLVTQRGIKIRGAGLEEAIEADAADFVFPDHEERKHQSFPYLGVLPPSLELPRPSEKIDEETGEVVKAKRAPKPEREPRPSRDGLVTALTLGNEMEVDPKLVRQALRKSGRVKPAVGWAWSTDELPAVYGDIVKHLKADVAYKRLARFETAPKARKQKSKK